MKFPKSILGNYSIGKVKSIALITTGLVHSTFAVKTDQGQFILQKLHAALASQAIAKDFLAVTRFLESEGFQTPKCVLTKSGDVLVKDGKTRWRMQTRIAGKTVDVLKDRSMAREAGEIYARFHNVLDKIDYKFKSNKILHETEKVYEKFLHVIKNRNIAEVQNEVEFLKREMPKYFLPTNLPMRVIHGDPKVSNILFSRDGKAKAIIDLDTCNRRPLLVELGDAFRSWCGNEEDDPQNKFCLRMFQSAWGGYKKGAEGFITARERKLVPKAIGTITLELACRFMTDYFEDNYFGWDSSRYPSRKAHNLARARGQIREFESYKEKLSKIKRIVG
jgi:Ser/Thr protein kinase RdoA (MazF antagonist)